MHMVLLCLNDCCGCWPDATLVMVGGMSVGVCYNILLWCLLPYSSLVYFFLRRDLLCLWGHAAKISFAFGFCAGFVKLQNVETRAGLLWCPELFRGDATSADMSDSVPQEEYSADMLILLVVVLSMAIDFEVVMGAGLMLHS